MRCLLPSRVATVEQGTVGNGNPIERLRTEAKIGQEVFFWMWSYRIRRGRRVFPAIFVLLRLQILVLWHRVRSEAATVDVMHHH